jgi:hypothetical protein
LAQGKRIFEMSNKEKIMDSEEFKKTRDALQLVMDAIRRLSETAPRNGTLPSMRVSQTWFLLDEACERLGLPKRGRPT